jgi:hypothetical protein
MAQQVQSGPNVTTTGLCTNGIACNPAVGDSAFSQAATTSLAQVIAAPTNAAQSVRITALAAQGYESATGGVLELEQGTGVNCASSTAVLAYVLYLPATAGISSASIGSGLGAVFIAKPGFAVCVIVTAGTVGVAGIAGTYTIY